MSACPPSAKRSRLKIAIACQPCRSKKVKCDGIRPACSNCLKKDSSRKSCSYGSGLSGAQIRRPRPPPASSEQTDEPEVRAVYCSCNSGAFAGEIKAAIDARLGLPSIGKLSLIPMTDAPLFGTLRRRQVSDKFENYIDNVLPPRRHADHLMDIYWQNLQPLEPILERESFSRSYQALFAGTSLEVDERVFLSSLNTVFALSTQVQENLEFQQRGEASNKYFDRAWTLLRPEAIIWEPGSLELVECLLLMSRYLQCTNNPHQTWMALGSAVRIAQSLGIHTPVTSSLNSSSRISQRKRQLWQCCVFLDRGISWVLGRTAISSLVISPIAIDSLQDNTMEENSHVPSAYYFTKMLELYEIVNHIMLSQATSNFGDKLDLPRLYQDNDSFGTVVQHDACLDKWEKSLPRLLRHDASQKSTNNVLYKQSLILRLRLLHARIHLFRPMLARLCLPQPQEVTSYSAGEGLGDRMLQDGAFLCIETAHKMVDLVSEHNKPDQAIGVLPWWHRILYLHVAGNILVAAMLRADLFTPMGSQYWTKAISALRAHESLSPYVQHCVETFQTLSSKISELHNPAGGSQFPLPDESLNTYFQDVFQDIGFDTENFLFGKEDMSWLGHFEAAQ